jgi:DNA polymerase III, alpha chain, Gram-positive type
MEKKFTDVFPKLNLSNEFRGLFSMVEVIKIATTTDRSSLRIVIKSPRLIEKDTIYYVEEQIKRQLFTGKRLNVKIYERFNLSEQYTPVNILEIYKESICRELFSVSSVVCHMFKTSDIKIENNIMSIVLEDNIVSRKKAVELKDYFEKLYTERFGFELEVCLNYIKTERKAKSDYSQRENEIEKYKTSNEIISNNENLETFEYELSNNDNINTSSYNNYENHNIVTNNIAEQSINSNSDIIPKGIKGSDKIEQNNDSNQNSKKYGGNLGNHKREFGRKKSANPDVLYGRDFDDEITMLENVTGEIGEIVVRGQIINHEQRVLKSGRSIIIFDITDFTDTITVKMFSKEDNLDEILTATKKGSYIYIKGMTSIDRFDGELTIASVAGVKKSDNFSSSRTDNASEKRVELHCHTKMSEMDAAMDVKDLIKRAKSWGMSAVAITDHGNVQSFPEANHAIDKNDEFKIIYGMEGYLADDTKGPVKNPKNKKFDDTFIVFDIETTGLSPVSCKIIEFGAVKIKGGKIVDRFGCFVDPKVPIPYEIEELTGINDNMVIGADTIDIVLPKFVEFCEDGVLVAHNAEFDVGFIIYYAKKLGINIDFTAIDTVALSRIILPDLKRYRLNIVAKALNIVLKNHHRAVDDAEATAEIFIELLKRCEKIGVDNLEKLNDKGLLSVEILRKMPTKHFTILATNDTGRINLYRLVSFSHLTYMGNVPIIPKSELIKYRDGLLLGSGCNMGELYQAILLGRPDEDIAQIVEFYDFLEIQPVENYEYMLYREKEPVNSIEDLQNINKRIVKLGELFGKPVVATGDVHFLDPEDEIYRTILLVSNPRNNNPKVTTPPLYFRTTEDMLESFSYLGPDKSKEVVVTNSNLIADKCEKISPVRPDKCPPVIPDSDKTLRNICYEKAHSMYGEDLPEVVIERLERELNSIISNGFAVMYIISQKLVWKSNEDGYLVGSRGSVGSSFVATMAGITEVNPLSPHYYCTKCHFSDFNSESVKKFSGMAGCDMPDRDCPTCGEKLNKDGFDIPFETFLGFKGNKEPDIDLNFSGEYQSKAHDYTEEIFGKGQTFRAGTIGTLAEKTAYGYVQGYFEKNGIRKRKAEITRLLNGCVGIKRTTGQHPGGIIVLPHGEEIYSFTPIQHPANDMKTKIITTHFDYHSIDHNLLKLDILGHDDPTMIRMLQDLIGIDPTSIPLDNKEVMSLFENTSALGIKPDDILGCKLGALGVPEFGTDFAMQMLIDAKPKYFSDLVRIAGLAHGTDVWLGNAQTLLQEGKATIQTAICTRDDIMTYLINVGVEQELSFTIMESVRKGKGLKPDWEDAMRECDVPEWYIWSCNKIKYMFPKAHAAAYVMMAWRIAYCKIFHPLEYYTSFFSIRATSFDYELMCMGKARIEHHIADYRSRMDSLSKKEQDTLKDMRIVQEMYARGYEFQIMDLYKAKATRFTIIDGKIMPAINSIAGLGEKAAYAVEEEAPRTPFLSKDDLWSRTKIDKKTIDKMEVMGIIKGLPETNQLSLFDFSSL